MGFSHVATRLIVLLSFATFASASFADEVIIDGRASSKISVGDFDCSQCPSPANNIFSLFDGNDREFTAGQLWKFFDEQGVSSVEHLVLCLDLQPSSETIPFGIDSFELKIENPSELGALLTNVSLGDNSLVFPGYDISSFKPEAKLEIALGYDFMERFSADSKEKISLDVSSANNGSMPVVSVEAGNGFFAQKFNIYALIVFAAFWSVVFLVLNRFTKPKIELPNSATSNITGGRRALSA